MMISSTPTILTRIVQMIVGCVLTMWIIACSSTTSMQPPVRGTDIIRAPAQTPQSTNEADGRTVGISPAVTSTKNTDPSVIDFSLSDFSHTPPDDVLQEVAYWEGAGGGPGVDCDTPGVERSTIWPLKIEQMQGISVLSCDWQLNEQLSFTLTYPNGISQTSTEMAEYSPYNNIVGVGVTFIPQVTDPLGIYSFQVTGLKKSLQGSFEVVKPADAHIQITDAGTLLYGFVPGEHVRYFAAQMDTNFPNFKCTLTGWQTFAIGPDGFLLVRNARGYSIVVGEISGEIHLFTPYSGCGSILVQVTKPCPNAPDSRLSLGRAARVISDVGSNVRVRSGPGTKYDKVASLPQGTTMSVVEGPVCSDTYVWWKVEVHKGPTGWVAEGEPNNYIVQPW